MFARAAFQPGIDSALDAPLAWYGSLRWLALAAIATTVCASCCVLRVLPLSAARPLWFGVGLLAAADFAFSRLRPRVSDARAFLLWQIGLDLALLTYFLHFAGGMENPLYVLYVLHVILAGILLPAGDAWAVAAAVVVLRLGVGVGEYTGALASYPLPVVLRGAGPAGLGEAPWLWGSTAALTTLVCGAAYFTTAIMGRLRVSQAALMRQERLSTLGRLVAFIAHETANPIGVISMRARMLRGGAKGDPVLLDESLEVIERQSDRVCKVIHSLLGYAKPQASKPSPIDLNRALDEALSIAQGRLSRAGIPVERSLSGALPSVRAGHSEAVHVFLNLLNNAVDAMPRGGRLRVVTRREGAWVEASVTDSGEGIPSENLGRVFEPFFTTKRREVGSGLGLSICRSLVRSSGGEIEVESAPGTGTTFRVRLPAAEGAA
ncbi:MAG: hypothetical protein KGL53_02110 [Elusimicrobia bacterium]|nr:hypothetical protein [Elusimicrobiota bacterium]